MFVDKAQIKIKAGNGGNGLVSFRREKFVTRGGPDGGNGGRGGDVIFKADNSCNNLSKFRYMRMITATNGKNGGRKCQTGKSGSDRLILVPVGTIVIDDQTKQKLVDLDQNGSQAIIATGGLGGSGNAHFKSSQRQAPGFAEKGQPGESRELSIELKLLADVGLVGLPNAGKSTLLSAISNARPAIADYPFTTLQPHLGVVDIDSDSILFADIPGLIAGAHLGKGLGFRFLKHIERNRIILHLIDCGVEQPGVAYSQIRQELTAYSRHLAKIVEVVAISKVDDYPDEVVEARLAELKQVVPKTTKIFAISSHSRQNLTSLLRAIKILVKKIKTEAKAEPDQELVVFRLETDLNFKVDKMTDGNFLVSGRKIEQFAVKTDFDNHEARQRLRAILDKLGIKRELKEHDCQDQLIFFGETKIGPLSLNESFEE